MSTINTVINIQNQSTGIMFPVNQSRVTDQEGFSVSQITVVDAEEQVSSEYASPRQVTLRLLSGDDVKVGLATGVYPLRLSGTNEAMVLRLDVEGRKEITTVTCLADTNGSLDGKYIELRELGDTKVWPWFNMARKAYNTLTFTANAANNETVVLGATTYTFKTALSVGPAVVNEVFIGASASDSLDNLIAAINAAAGAGTLYGTGTTANATVSAAAGAGDTLLAKALTAGTAGNAIIATETFTNGAWSSAGGFLAGGTAASTAPTVTTERLIQVDITEDASASAVATALNTAMDADTEFSATVATAAVAITDRYTGTRTAATHGDTGWASAPAETQAGAASPIVYLRSTGTSQVVVGVVPN